MNEPTTTPTRPYLIRALHEWCTDNGLTPYLVVKVDRSVQVPREHVNDGEIVLNVGYDATGSLQLGNEYIEFKARFGGKAREIMVPVERIQAIYARETGQGMSFPVIDREDAASEAAVDLAESAPSVDVAADSAAQVVPLSLATATAVEDAEPSPLPPTSTGAGRPSLKRVK